MNFEQFLQEKFADSVDCTEDDPGKDVDAFHDAFCDWMEELPIENIIRYADEFKGVK
jgi:hypothetical protein